MRGGRRCGWRSRSSRAASARRPHRRAGACPKTTKRSRSCVGTLRADAAVTPTGVSISLDVDRRSSAIARSARGPIPPFGRRRAVSGGVQATVAGSLGAERAGEWRAGRRVRVPLQLHRPSRYLDPDVPDSERALARRGTTLVGTVKSGALVELIGARLVGRRSDRRGSCRLATRDRSRRRLVESAFRGDRRRHRDRRSRGPGR